MRFATANVRERVGLQITARLTSHLVVTCVTAVRYMYLPIIIVVVMARHFGGERKAVKDWIELIVLTSPIPCVLFWLCLMFITHPECF